MQAFYIVVAAIGGGLVLIGFLTVLASVIYQLTRPRSRRGDAAESTWDPWKTIFDWISGQWERFLKIILSTNEAPEKKLAALGLMMMLVGVVVLGGGIYGATKTSSSSGEGGTTTTATTEATTSTK